MPRIRELNAEYAQLLERKKKNYVAEYRQQKAQMQDWLMAQKIVSVMLDEKEQKETEIKRQEERKTPGQRSMIWLAQQFAIRRLLCRLFAF